MFGDSITLQNLQGSNLYEYGTLVWAMQYLGARFEPLIYGHSGYRTDQLIAETSAVVSSSASVVVVHAGTNDVNQGVDGETIYNNLKTIWDTFQATGKIVVATTILPRNYGGDTSTKLGYLADANRRIRAYCNGASGRPILCDWHNAVVTPSTGLADTSFFSDGVHPNVTGASRLGLVLSRALESFVPPSAAIGFAVDPYSSRWATANPFLAGDAGSGFATSLGNELFGSATINSQSKESRTDGQAGEWQVVDVTAAASSSQRVELYLGGVAGRWAAGDTLQAVAEVEIVSGTFQHLGAVVLQNPPYAYLSEAPSILATSVQTPWLPVGTRLVLKGIPQTTSGTPTLIQARLRIVGTGVLRVGTLGVIKIN